MTMRDRGGGESWKTARDASYDARCGGTGVRDREGRRDGTNQGDYEQRFSHSKHHSAGGRHAGRTRGCNSVQKSFD